MKNINLIIWFILFGLYLAVDLLLFPMGAHQAVGTVFTCIFFLWNMLGWKFRLYQRDKIDLDEVAPQRIIRIVALVIQIIVSLIITGIHNMPIKWFALIEILLLGITLVIVLVTDLGMKQDNDFRDKNGMGF